KPVLGGGLVHLTFTVEWSVPLARSRIKAIWPADKPLHFRSKELDLKPRVETSGDSTVYVWERRNEAPVIAQPNLPPDIPAYGYIEMSSTTDWQDVVDVTLPHYRLDKELPAAFVARLDTIAARFPKPDDRLVETSRLVQDDIRYVSLSIGSGSHIPRPPAEVLASGFGDCKDKSLLLATALARLGITASVALTDIDEGPALRDRLPGIPLFDHMIVKAVIGAEVYWIDPTVYLQGGRAEDLAPPTYGYALPLERTGAQLEPIPSKPLLKPTVSVAETFTFPDAAGAPLTLGVKTTYLGAAADTMRYRLRRESIAKISDDYVRYYNGQYPGIRSVASLQTTDDRDANVVIVAERYELTADDLAADDLAKDFPLKGDFGLTELPTPSRVGRTAPIWLGHPFFKQHKSSVQNLKARFSAPADSEMVASPFAILSTVTSATDTTFEVTWNFITLTDRIPAAYLGKYLRTLDEMSENSKWTFDFTYVAPSTE
ncbi:MAG: DUF3857 domain-containing protein, partial [Mesorhizobium sp.]|nr:DUF3857 domain-containing protein [Mesorhizobium sp.]